MTKNQRCIQWTQTAKECYDRGCVCKECPIKDLIETHCFMKTAVIELVRKFGKPPKKLSNLFTSYELSVLDSIKDGCNTFADIAERLNKSKTATEGIVHLLYKKARLKGWKPKEKGIVNKSLLPQFISFVRNGGFEGC
jgi:hypothetical protein